MSNCRIVLFDIGNVLFCDPWETLFLTPGRGLVDRLGWSRDDAIAVARDLWEKFSVDEYEEGQYWAEVEGSLGVSIPKNIVDELNNEILYKNPDADHLLDSAKKAGHLLGVASNNTSFWFQKQWDRIGLGGYIDTSLVFVSHQMGIQKSSPGRGLLEAAAETVPAHSAMLIDARRENIRRANEIGFMTSWYSMSDLTPPPSFN